MKRKKNILFPLWAGLGLYAAIRLANDSVSGIKSWERGLSTTILEASGAVVLSYFVILGIRFMIGRFDKKTFSSPRKQITYELFSVWLFTVLVFNIFANLLAALTDDGLQYHDVILNNLLGSLITILLYLYFRVNHFLEAFVTEKVKREKLQREKAETELKYLKAQINPHFLFNALNGIYFQIEDTPKAAQQTLDRFSKMLRYQLYECSAEQVSLQKEIAFLNDYIEIEQMRKSEKLRLEINLPNHSGQWEIAPFLLQPLVENAFKHLGGALWISIKGKIEGNCLFFCVQNSIGTNPVENNLEPGGIGLSNLKRRLNLLYPQRYEFSTLKEQDSFTATLKLNLDEN